MKLLFIILIIFVSLLLTTQLVSANQTNKKDKQSPLLDGHLLICPDKPNCINTEYPEHTRHYLAPFVFSKSQQDHIMSLAKNILINMEAHIIIQDDHYLHATFTSSVFKFVDDFELRQDNKTYTLHIRSASRTGYSDFGVNKRRVKKFLEQINQAINNNPVSNRLSHE